MYAPMRISRTVLVAALCALAPASAGAQVPAPPTPPPSPDAVGTADRPDETKPDPGEAKPAPSRSKRVARHDSRPSGDLTVTADEPTAKEHPADPPAEPAAK